MKNNQAGREDAVQKYDEKQAEIRKLLAQIEYGLEKNDRNRSEGITWGSVEYLAHIASELRDIKDSLHGTGEYAK